MKLGTIRRINKEDLGKSGELPSWIDQLILPLNQFIEAVVTALAGRVSFADNIQCKIITQTFTSGTEAVINPQSALRPIGIIPVLAQDKSIDKYKFTYKANGQIGITLTFDGGGEASATVFVLF